MRLGTNQPMGPLRLADFIGEAAGGLRGQRSGVQGQQSISGRRPQQQAHPSPAHCRAATPPGLTMSMRVQGRHSLVQRVEVAARKSVGHCMCGLLIASDGRQTPTQYLSRWDGAQRCLRDPGCLRMFLLLSAAPVRPLGWLVRPGLDTCLSIMKVLHNGLGDSKYRPCPLLQSYVDAGWVGQKAGKGNSCACQYVMCCDWWEWRRRWGSSVHVWFLGSCFAAAALSDQWGSVDQWQRTVGL